MGSWLHGAGTFILDKNNRAIVGIAVGILTTIIVAFISLARFRSRRKVAMEQLDIRQEILRCRIEGYSSEDDQVIIREVIIRDLERYLGASDTVPPLLEPPRYTDIAFHEGYLYPIDFPSATERLPDHEPLVESSLYTLEVAVRLHRQGIGTRQDIPAVKNPREGLEDLTIYVLAKPLPTGQESHIEIEECLAKVLWRYNQDSEPALFRLKTKSGSGGRLSTIEVRLYDGSLDLLDIVTVSAKIVARANVGSTPEELTQQVSWPNLKAGELHIDPSSRQRDLSINVSQRVDGYEFDFLLRTPDGQDVINIPVFRNIQSRDLENLLVEVRDFWMKLVITNYGHSLTVTLPTFENYLKELALLGSRAWTLLFGDRQADQSGTSEVLGELLGNRPLNRGAMIQITHSGNLNSFVFPWSILHPPTALTAGKIFPDNFWGFRYKVEQVIQGPMKDGLSERPVRMIFALDPNFGNSSDQKNLFKEYSEAHSGDLIVTEPITSEQALFDELIRSPAAHLLYCYCHGYASWTPGPIRFDGAKRLKHIIETLPEGSSERNALQTLMALTSKAGSESWMYIGDSQVNESTLRMLRFFAPKRRPIVFLNMCQSADLVPSMSSGLVRVFLDHNASAVIGTESPMTPVFASVFATDVLRHLFQGEDIGTALWQARRHYVFKMRNPLGLAYTLYGRATTRLGAVESGWMLDAAHRDT
jgi:hypothetical protein